MLPIPSPGRDRGRAPGKSSVNKLRGTCKPSQQQSNRYHCSWNSEPLNSRTNCHAHTHMAKCGEIIVSMIWKMVYKIISNAVQSALGFHIDNNEHTKLSNQHNPLHHGTVHALQVHPIRTKNLVTESILLKLIEARKERCGKNSSIHHWGTHIFWGGIYTIG